MDFVGRTRELKTLQTFALAQEAQESGSRLISLSQMEELLMEVG